MENPENTNSMPMSSTPEIQAPMAANVEGMPAPTTIETPVPPVTVSPTTAPEVMQASDVAPVSTETTPKEEHKSIFDWVSSMLGGKKSATTPASQSPVVTTEATPTTPVAPTQETAPAPFAPPADPSKAA